MTESLVGRIVGKAFQDVAETFLDWVRQGSAFIVELQRGMERWSRYVHALGDRGWVISPYMPIRVIVEIMVSTDEDPDAAHDHLEQYYDARLEECLTPIRTVGAMRGWVPKIESARWAHENGFFELAVPMWLILLEASLRSIGEHRGDPTFKTFTARTREKYRKRFENLVPNSTTICIDVVSNVLHQLGARNAGPAATTRASILHGIDARFGSRRQSLQLIALLYAVWMLVLETEEQIAS